MEQKNIAVIGGGVSGIVAAYLLSKKYQVTLLEQNDYLGGHTNTRYVTNEQGEKLPVDTGFIVFNYQTYPNFIKFIRQLGVEEIDAPMTFAYHNRKTGIQYSSVVPQGLFADWKNLFRPSFLRMLLEILSFSKQALYDLAHTDLSGLTLGSYIKEKKFSREFINYYLIPMAAAVWSSPKTKVLDFPCYSFLSFYNNHGMLDLKHQLQWKTIKGGSIKYVEAFKKVFNGKIRLSARVKQVLRQGESVKVQLADGSSQPFDAVVIAAHADQALALLADPDDQEKRILGSWSYSTNETALHTDPAVMPRSKRAWGAWNYFDTGEPSPQVALTYYMNLLQSLPGRTDYFVSLNSRQMIDGSKIRYETVYHHPLYDFKALASQKDLPLLKPDRNTFFCGSYCYHGFHEDAVKAACKVAGHFGVGL